jgi:hypothetical protein
VGIHIGLPQLVNTSQLQPTKNIKIFGLKGFETQVKDVIINMKME